MNGEAQRNEQNNAYTPSRPEQLLCVFVDKWFRPKGMGGDTDAWQVGRMSAVLSYLMSASQCPHAVISGDVVQVIKGKEVRTPHLWIEVQKDEFKEGEASVEIYDPGREQFGWPDVEFKYEAKNKWPTVSFMPHAIQGSSLDGHKVKEITSVSVGTNKEFVSVAVSPQEDFPEFRLQIPSEEALNLAVFIFKVLGIKSENVQKLDKDDKEIIHPPVNVEQEKWRIKEKYEGLLRLPREELRVWSNRLIDHSLPIEWKATALMEVNTQALLIAKIELEYKKELEALKG